MKRVSIAVIAALVAVSAGASEPAALGMKHVPSILICSVAGVRYASAASFKLIGTPKEDIEAALLASKGAGETDESIQIVARQVVEYAMEHSVQEILQHAEAEFVGCLAKSEVPVDSSVAGDCWYAFRRDQVMVDQRAGGASKQSMLDRAGALAETNEAAAKIAREAVERVYGASGDLDVWLNDQLMSCLGAPPASK